MAEINVFNLNITSDNPILKAHNDGKDFDELYKGILDRIPEEERGADLFENSVNNVLEQYWEAAEYVSLNDRSKKTEEDVEEDDDGNEVEVEDESLSWDEKKRLKELQEKFEGKYGSDKTAEKVAREFGGYNALNNLVSGQYKDDKLKKRITNLLSTYDKIKEDPAKLESFKYLYSVSENFKQHASASKETTVKFNDKALMLEIHDLNGTGLNFTIDSNKSLVMSQEKALTQEQVDALATFMYDDAGLRKMEDFDFKDIKDLKVKGKEGEEDKPFMDAFSESLSKADENYNSNEEDWTQEAFEQWCRENGLEGHEPAVQGPFDDIKGMKLDRKAFKDKVIARMNILGFTDPRLIKTRYCTDGSMILTCYTTENDIYDDMQTKDGLRINRKKAFSVKLKYKNGVPVVSYYLPQGKVLEGGHARVMLEALKSQGCTHAYLPGAMITAGKGQGALWEAVAKSLVCPMALPDGNELKPQNIVDIMETLKKENDPDRQDILGFKRNLLEQLEIQEEHKRKKDPNYKMNSHMNVQMELLKGAIYYETFNASSLPNLQKFIAERSQIRTAGNKQWDKITVLAANQAIADITQNYGIIREKYGDHDLTDQQLQYELIMTMKFGILDKNGNPIGTDEEKKPKGTLEIIKEEIKNAEKEAARTKNTPDKQFDAALKAVNTAVSKRLGHVNETVKADYGIDLVRDPGDAYASAKMPERQEVKDINMKDIVAKTFNRPVQR